MGDGGTQMFPSRMSIPTPSHPIGIGRTISKYFDIYLPISIPHYSCWATIYRITRYAASRFSPVRCQPPNSPFSFFPLNLFPSPESPVTHRIYFKLSARADDLKHFVPVSRSFLNLVYFRRTYTMKILTSSRFCVYPVCLVSLHPMQRRSFDRVDNLFDLHYYDFMLTKNDLQQIKIVVDDSLQPLKQDVSTLKADVSGLKNDVSDLKKDTSSLKLNILTLRTDLLMLKSDVSTLKTDVTGLKSDVSILKQDVSTLKSDVSGVKQDVATVIKPTFRL